MRRIAVGITVGLVAGLAGSAGESVATLQSPPHAKAVLAIVSGPSQPRLGWVNPATLRPLAHRSVALPYGGWSPVFAPAGRHVALGSSGRGGVQIVDLRRMRVTARIARTPSNRSLTPVAWPEPRRLLVLDRPGSESTKLEELLVIDPVARRVVGRVAHDSSTQHWVAWASAGKMLVALVSRGVGISRLVAYGPGGGVLSAADVGIAAGSIEVGGTAEEPHFRLAQPGLAVDPEGRRAFVVDAQRVAVVDLASFEVSYAQIAESRPLLARIRSWLEPSAYAKLVSGFSRRATWLGAGKLAVTGSTYHDARGTPAGLHLVDGQTGVTRMLEPRASGHALSRGVLLAFGASRDGTSGATTGMGITAFTPTGEPLWSALRDEPVWSLETAGGYAYAATPETSFPQGIRVVDLTTGEVLRTVRGEMPTFVIRG
jgi:hypothetical protein